MPVIRNDLDEDLDTPAATEAAEGPRSLLNSSVLAGRPVEVGDKIVLRVTRVMPDQIEVEYGEGDGDGAENDENGVSSDATPSGDNFYD